MDLLLGCLSLPVQGLGCCLFPSSLASGMMGGEVGAELSLASAPRLLKYLYAEPVGTRLGSA